jgi:hypothetical protein
VSTNKTKLADTKEVKRLRRAIRASLKAQGFTVAKDLVSFRQKNDKRSIRKRHEHAVAKKAELASLALLHHEDRLLNYIASGQELDPACIKPKLVQVEPDTEHSRLFRYACLHWSSRTGLSGVITKHHSHHYFGFAETQWNLFLKESPRRVKPLLYVYRVLLTGIHLMRTGRVEANLVTMNEVFRLPYIPELVARKLAGPEKSKLEDADIAFHESEYQRLRGELQVAHDASQLPELPSDETRTALNDMLVRIRMANKFMS